MTHRLRTLATLSLAAALAACGGGDDAASTTTGGTTGGGSGTLTLSAATPAANNTTLNLASAGTTDNLARAADAFSSQAYCEVFYENVTAANGAVYALQVYFRQSDKAVLNVSVIANSGWVVFDNNAGNPITGITVDTAARTLTFNSKVATDGAGATATLSGTASFPANASAPACGA